MEKFEQYKMLEYLNNALAHRTFFKQNLNNVYDWYEDYGKNIINYTWLTKEEKENFSDFRDFYNSKKTQAIKHGDDFRKRINQKIKILQKNPISFLEKRIRFIAELLHLSDIQKEIFAFFARLKIDDNFDDFCRSLCGRNNKMKQNASLFLAISQYQIEQISDTKSPLIRFGLLENDYNGDLTATDLSIKLLAQNLSSCNDVKNVLFGDKCSSSLQWEDFSHIEEKDFCAQILANAIKNKEKGINLLFYGEPGTGKTEFAKTLTDKIQAELYAVGEKFEDINREENLNLAYSILSQDDNSCLLIDEADDFLTPQFFKFSRKKDDNKLYVNRLLENNLTPAIWIINSIEDIDKSYLRRFTYALHFRKPTLKTRTEMWQKALKNHHLSADEKTAQEFAVQYKLPPSFITSAVKAASLANGGLSAVKQSLLSLEKAYNNGKLISTKPQKRIDFNPLLLNTDTDLNLLAQRIKSLSCRNFSLCLYGASGTGKSAYAEYLAQLLGMPAIKKKCSDLLSMWVGGTERNINEAFEEGRENLAVLIFDEADSFLQDRNSASHSWEVTQVNEMLTQMENYPYPFVCTTNLMNSLDKASLRRFTFKVAYDYMTPQQRSWAFKHFFGIADIDLSGLNSLTPGDFVVVKQKAEILGLLDTPKEIIKMLKSEQLNKAPVHNKIGFL